MEEYKKRTISLILASVLTVGSMCFADGFKNSVCLLHFTNESDKTVNMVLATKKEYSHPISTFKKDANTYIITLPEVDSQLKTKPKLGNNIENVDIKTHPYSSNGKGYTRITVKTASNVNLVAKSSIFVESKEADAATNKTKMQEQNKSDSIHQNNSENETFVTTEQAQADNNEKNESNNEIEAKAGNPQSEQVQNNVETPVPEDIKTPAPVNITSDANTKLPRDNGYEILLGILGILLIIVVVIFSYIKGKEKISELIGEQGGLDIENKKKPKDDKKKQKTVKKTDIKSTIDILDKTYSQPYKMSAIQENSPIPLTPSPKTKVEEDVILDLDALFRKTKNNDENGKDEYVNSDLDDFLSSFVEESDFEEIQDTNETEQESIINQEKEITYDKEFLQKFLEQENIVFTEKDITVINQILIDITDDTQKNIEKYTEIAKQKVSSMTKLELLEYFVLTYTTDNHITFTKEDIEALNKLINVEIDNDFITDLRTNPAKVEQMREEILESKTIHNTEEVSIIKVKDSLPNLAVEGKNYDTEYDSSLKNQVINYDKDCSLQTLSIADELPDLNKEILNEEAYKPRPSDGYEVALQGYEVEKLHISYNELPDLKDVIANPNKYKEVEEEVFEANADTLLQSLSNVTFKPFYEENYEDSIVETEMLEPDDEKDFAEFFQEDSIPEKIQNEKPKRKVRTESVKHFAKNKIHKQEFNTETPQNCIVDGHEYQVISECKISDTQGCYLVKDGTGYCVIGFNGENTQKIKSYETLKSQTIQTRVNDKLSDGTLRCLVKIGLKKFLMSFSANNMEYLMDLC